MQERRLVLPGEHVLLALSGGPDSTALAHVLLRLRAEWDLTLSAIHVNHGLRGSESNDDETFVRAFCESHAIPLTVRKGPVEKKHSSLQAAARDIRRTLFREEIEARGARVIATAHTMTDRAETVLLNLTRGAGLRGIAGITYRRNRFVRPLLDVDREAVLHYLETHDLAFREDSSNENTDYHRNKLRLSIVPEIERALGRSITAPLARSAGIAAEAHDFIAHVASQWLTDSIRRDEKRQTDVIDTGPLRRLPPAVGKEAVAQAARRWAESPYSPSREIVESLWVAMESGESKRFRWNDCDFVVEGGVFAICPRADAPPPASRELAVPGRLALDSGAIVETSRPETRPEHLTGRPHSLDEAWMDADLVKEPLHVRVWREGDRFHPLGAPGNRKLQDLFVDRKIPRTVRGRVPLVEDAEGIVWVAGVEIADRVRVTERTRAIIEVAIHWGGCYDSDPTYSEAS
ncbi:MAG: tRNA lysidine(34) synthetase TilS [Gemmatimonadetes bacterium]|nr:tRNA lysidine(34) synthetase TilS [Gemmatimonadota bacterium]